MAFAIVQPRRLPPSFQARVRAWLAAIMATDTPTFGTGTDTPTGRSMDGGQGRMDEHEFGRILRQHAGLLTRIATSYEVRPTARDDLLQDIALALWKAIPKWRGDASLKTFIARVAHNRGASHVVRATRRPAHEGLDENHADEHARGPQAHAAQVQDQERVQEAVRTLPLSLRQAVTLALEGFKQREIADALGIGENNVAVRLHRARRALKARLGETA